MTLSEELAWRGFVNQTTLKDISALDTRPLTFYWGVDPSADSMTVGNLAMAMMVRHFIEYGHKAVLLIGGATGMIGDPDGKDEERSLRPLEEIEHNKTSITAEYDRIFEGKDFEVVDNYDWFRELGYLEFLRDIGKHFSMTQLLDRDFVQARVGEGGRGISYAEFSYSLIQGYDFLHLYREKGVTLQVAGADQWGNSISGVNLVRKLEGAEAHIWTGPIIVNSATGKKFGKSEEGAVWLNESKTSVYKFYQFWLNVDDQGVANYLKIYTLLPKEAIEHLVEVSVETPHTREAQKSLAYEVTKLVHGHERAESVKKVTGVLFGGAGVADLSETELSMLVAEIPSVRTGTTLVAALIDTGLASSKSEAARLIHAGAVTINGEKCLEDRHLDASPLLIKRGKNGFCLIVA